ncbi:hypothetical protein ACNKHW_26065 [Shigella flexneri]
MTTVEHVGLPPYRQSVEWQEGRDLWWHDAVSGVSAEHSAEEMNAEIRCYPLYLRLDR